MDRLRVLAIEEDDYGCEELPEGAEPMVNVTVEGGGETQCIRMPYGQTKMMRPGDAVRLTAEGMLENLG